MGPYGKTGYVPLSWWVLYIINSHFFFIFWQQRIIIRTFIEKGRVLARSKSKKAYAMRCNDAFLMQCLVLKLKSSKAYRHIQQECMLPLPSKSTLRSLLSSSECKFGFNDLALSCIKEALTGLPLSHRGGTINHDEISIKKDIAFYKETVEHHKIVDFGDDLTAKYQNGVADYVLVFIFHPYRAVGPAVCLYCVEGGCDRRNFI